MQHQQQQQDGNPQQQQQMQTGFSPFAGSAHSSGFLPPTPPRMHMQHASQDAHSLGRLPSLSHQTGHHATAGQDESSTSATASFYSHSSSQGSYSHNAPGGGGFSGGGQNPNGGGGYGGLNRANSSSFGGFVGGFGGSTGGTGTASSPAAGSSPVPLPPAMAAAELLCGSSIGDAYAGQQQMARSGSAAAALTRQLSGNLMQQQQQQQQQYQQQQHRDASGWGYGAAADQPGDGSSSLAAAAAVAAAAAAAGLPPSYHSSPLSRSSTMTAQQLLHQQHHHHQQQQQAAIGRSYSLDVNVMAAAHAAAAGMSPHGGRWGGGRMQHHMGGDASGHGGMEQQGRLFGAVYDMKSLTAALSHVQAGTGDVRRMLASCTFRPRLPGLTKLVSQMSREGHWAKALEVYESLDAVGVRPDTTITNAAISACDKGGQWEKALQVFRSMSDLGMERDAITYSALISALSKGRQWGMAIDVFNHMVAEGVECDAVTCCSLITALDKGGQWQLAEQVFIQMYQAHTQFHVLLEGMQQDSPGGGGPGSVTGSPSLLAGTFSAAALSALSIQEDQLPPAEQLASLAPPGLQQQGPAALAVPAGPDAPAAGDAAGAAGTAFGSAAAAGAPGGAASEETGDAGPSSHQDKSVPSSSDGQQQPTAAAHSSPNSVLTRSLSAQLSDVGLYPPGRSSSTISSGAVTDSTQTPAGGAEAHPSGAAAPSAPSAFAAAAVPAAAGPPTSSAAPLQMAAASPSRPPVHPLRRDGSMAAMAAAAVPGGGGVSSPSRSSSGLQRAGSIGSPSGTIGLRMGRAGSLNSKKNSPNRVCCNALLAAYARAVPPRWKQALRLLEVMWQCGGELVPDIVSYNTVMKACGNAQQTDIAFQLYHHMQQRGIEPTVATYGTLITIASEAQAYSRVKESWGWLKASGLPVHITCVNSYLTALIKEDNWDAAVELFNQLKANQLGVRPNSVTYNILMSACLARDKPQHVKALFDEMTSSSLSPTLISFNTLLHAYAKMGAWQESMGLLQHLCSSSAVRPSATSFNTVFCTLSNVAAAVSDMDKTIIFQRALDVYALMLDQPGIHPDTTLYRNMVATFAACRAPQMVLQLAVIMIQQGHNLDPSTAAAALEALQQDGAWHLAGQLLRGCFAAGTIVAPAMVRRLLVHCSQQGAWKAAREVLQFSASTGTLDAIGQHLHDFRRGAASGQPDTYIHNPEAFDELLFLSFLQGQLGNGGWLQGLELFQQLKADRGPGFAAANAAVHGALLELLVVRGGTEGLLAAVQVVDECHVTGSMGHYLLPPSLGGPATPSSTRASPLQSALSAGMLSPLTPQQQLILQLEQQALSSSPPSVAAVAGGVGGGMYPPGGPGGLAGFGAPPGLGAGGLAGLGLSPGGGADGGQFGGAGGGSPGLVAEPLSVLDVSGCSAVEAVVLLLSWLGQVVQLQASGMVLPGEVLRIATGGSGAPSQAELTSIVLYSPIAAAGAAGAAGAAVAPAAVAVAAAPAGEEESAQAQEQAQAAAGGLAPAADGEAANGDAAAAQQGVPAAGGPAAGHPAAAPAGHGQAELPGSDVSVHAAVLAVLSGQLSGMLGCGGAMELLVPFSGAGRLALGLLCCSAVPLVLPDGGQGGGVLLPVEELTGSIAAAVEASRA